METVDEAVGSRPRVRVRRLLVIALFLVAVAGGAAWYFGVVPASRPPGARANAIMVLAPYQYQGTWVFDDPSTGLAKEPFVAGIPEMIDVLVEDIPEADKGFRLLFSARPFPGHQRELTWLRGDSDGNFYAMEDPHMEGWLCPAMFKYYAEAPEKLYVKAEAIE